MTELSRALRVAILDDYLGAADAVMRDSLLPEAVEITVFRTPVPSATAADRKSVV